jgi:hypothetical protein
MVLGSGIRDPRSGIRDPRSGIRDPGSGIRKKPIPDPGSRGQKAPDPGSGSATLIKSHKEVTKQYLGINVFLTLFA